MRKGIEASAYFEFDENHGHHPGPLIRQLSEKVRNATPDNFPDGKADQPLIVHEFPLLYPEKSEKIYKIAGNEKSIVSCATKNENVKLFCDEQDEPYFYVVGGNLVAGPRIENTDYYDRLQSKLRSGAWE